jgi:hypothetical protein
LRGLLDTVDRWMYLSEALKRSELEK